MRPSASASMSFSVSAVSGQVRATKSVCGSSAPRSDVACSASACPAPARVAADADHAHVERFCELREPAAYLSEADDEQRLAAETRPLAA